jgi:hypothetical protein
MPHCTYCHTEIRDAKQLFVIDEIPFCSETHRAKFLADEQSHRPKPRTKNKRSRVIPWGARSV